jgi:hypothetical protein
VSKRKISTPPNAGSPFIISLDPLSDCHDMPVIVRKAQNQIERWVRWFEDEESWTMGKWMRALAARSQGGALLSLCSHWE